MQDGQIVSFQWLWMGNDFFLGLDFYVKVVFDFKTKEYINHEIPAWAGYRC